MQGCARVARSSNKMGELNDLIVVIGAITKKGARGGVDVQRTGRQ